MLTIDDIRKRLGERPLTPKAIELVGEHTKAMLKLQAEQHGELVAEFEKLAAPLRKRHEAARSSLIEAQLREIEAAVAEPAPSKAKGGKAKRR